MPSSTEIQMKIAEIEAAILNNHPSMPNLLREIHTTLKASQETVTLLSDLEVGTIITGLQKFTGNFITAKAVAKPKASLKNMSLDDF